MALVEKQNPADADRSAHIGKGAPPEMGSQGAKEALAEKIIVALDVDSEEEAYSLVRQLSPLISYYKVGFRLFLTSGPRIISGMKKLGVRVFLDQKFHDIPNTVATAAEVAVSYGVDMFNIHLSGGREMMLRTVEAAEKASHRYGVPCPTIVGVTVLTSFNEQTLREEAGVERSMEEHVLHLARLAKESGMHGVVASSREAPLIREKVSEDLVIVTPGIRPSWSAADDQQRILTPRHALESGSTYLVIGRPIIADPSPREAAEKILAEMDAV